MSADRGLTHEEIGRRLGLTRSAVAKIEARALRKLREALDRLERENEAKEYGLTNERGDRYGR